MAPAQNLLRRHYDSFVGYFDDTHLEFNQEKDSLISGLMAGEEDEGEEEVGTSTSKEGDDATKDWLQLGIGSSPHGSSDNPTDRTSSSSQGNLGPMEINLFPERPPLPTTTAKIRPMVTRGHPWPAPMTTSYSFGQFAWPSSSSRSSAGSGNELRVVSPPVRTQTGVWFELKAARNQGKGPFLPQIPQSYLRIKDGRMTVRLLMKYLANKLGLDDESEVEITCRGQQLHPILTLQHIRDNIWCTRTTVTMIPLDLPITDHVMILQYSRRA